MTNKLALVVAVVLGVLSIIGIRLYVDKMRMDYEVRVDPVDCFVAARDVAAGRTFTNDDVVETQFPRAIDNAFRNSRITDKTTIIGARTVQPIAAGQVLQTYHFARATRSKGLEFKPEFRAVTIPVNKVSGVGGLLRPTDTVDVILSMKLVDQQSAELAVTRTLFKGVMVLATDLVTDPFDPAAGQGYTTITLRLNPEECNKLVFSLSNGGTVHLAQCASGTTGRPGYDPVIADDFYREIRDELKR